MTEPILGCASSKVTNITILYVTMRSNLPVYENGFCMTQFKIPKLRFPNIRSNRFTTITYLLIVLISAYIIHLFLPKQQSFWIVWSAFVFSLISLGVSFHRRLQLITYIALVCAIAAFIASLCASSIVALAVYLFIITGVSIYFAENKPEYSLFVFIVPIFAILGGRVATPFSAHILKLVLILAGALIVILAQFVFFSQFKTNEMRRWFGVAIDRLQVLSEEIFSCFQPAYQDNVYLFERRIHIQKMKFMRALQNLREFAAISEQKEQNDINQQNKSETTHNNHADIISTLESLYDILLDCSQLRNRISDPTIFSICTQEMNGLISAIQALFKQLKLTIDQPPKEMNSNDVEQTVANPGLNTQPLAEQVMRFDEIYQNVLQVTASEPTVFVLFIESIKKLEQAMQTFYAGLITNEFI